MEPIADRARALLLDLGLIAATDEVAVEPLAGGVSSDIARATTSQAA